MVAGPKLATLGRVVRVRPQRCRERLERLADSSLGSEELRHEAATELQRTLGFDLWCWGLADPVSLLAYSGVASQLPPEQVARVLPRLLALEQQETTLPRHAIAHAPRPVSTLSAATGGELERSRRWAECLGPVGLGDLAVLACRDASGCWGWLEAYRAGDDRPFAPEETSLLASVAAVMGDGLRHRAGEAGPLVGRRPAGVLILDQDLRATSWTPAAREWVADMPGPIHETVKLLPSVIYAVAGRATAPPDGVRTSLGAAARVQTRGGGWAIVEGEVLEGAATTNIAITIRAADGEEALALLCRLRALTARECEVAQLVVRGLTTSQIAECLVITEHTVKDHLKSIFDKTGARARNELAARVLGTPPQEPRPAAGQAGGSAASTKL
jgi:DNA-binding CsgD family transcriptional regulator